MRDKLIRLQKLYIDQFQRLQYLLREERRKYRHSVRREKENQLMSVHRQPKQDPGEMAAYEKLKALNHYSKPQGVEAVLQAQLMEKRTRAGNSTAEPPKAPPGTVKCQFNLTESTKCGETSIPSMKYCSRHVLSDPAQMLFRACGVVTDADDAATDGPCAAPVPDIGDVSVVSCLYHTSVQNNYANNTSEESKVTLRM